MALKEAGAQDVATGMRCPECATDLSCGSQSMQVLWHLLLGQILVILLLACHLRTRQAANSYMAAKNLCAGMRSSGRALLSHDPGSLCCTMPLNFCAGWMRCGRSGCAATPRRSRRCWRAPER